MARHHSPYKIYKRTGSRPKRSVFYAVFRDGAGAYGRTESTGCTRRDDAVRWADARLAAMAQEHTGRHSGEISLADYAAGFWSPEGHYAQSRLARGFAPARGYLDIAESNTRNHLIPEFGTAPLRAITPAMIDAWAVRLYREGKLAGTTVNKLLYTLRVMLDEAVAERRISENPATRIKPVATGHRKPGRLEADEIVRLFATPEPWGDFRLYAVNLFAAATGARMGECRGLLVEDVKADHVEIKHSWEQGHGLKAPKYNSIRTVPISERVAEALSRVIRDTGAESIVFYGRTLETPVSKSWAERGLYRALANIGVDAKARGIVFHSHRHALNSELRAARIPDAVVQRVTGHRTEAMTEHYTAFALGDFAPVLDVQRRLLGVPA